MKISNVSQSIIVSGETGSGKSESTEHLIRYLSHATPIAAQIEQQMIITTQILEAFGNARTPANNNSSRFAKLLEVNFSCRTRLRSGRLIKSKLSEQVHYDENYHVVGMRLKCFLLEKSRVCAQSHDESNFHIFYILCTSAPESLRNQLGILQSSEHYAVRRILLPINKYCWLVDVSSIKRAKHRKFVLNK